MADLVHVEGRELTVSNLGKELYPGFTKAQVISYYAELAAVLLPHVTGRPVTLRRWPDGVGAGSFVQKHAARDVPDWLHTELVPGRGDTPVRHAVLDEPAALVWAANLAALELHVPQWRFSSPGRGAAGAEATGTPQPPDLLVLDLDPGAPADVVACCAVALRLRELLAEDGLTARVKTSGSAGLHLLVPVLPGDPGATSVHAKALAQRLAAEQPGRVVWQMTRALRPDKVFVDWSQNNTAKTTVAAYSLRGKASPTVSTPLTWEEVAGCTRATELVFTPDDVRARVAEHGDLLAGMAVEAGELP